MSENQRIVYVERPRSNGCLWGCMGVLLIVALPLIVSWGYGAWFLYRGFRDSPMMRTAIELTVLVVGILLGGTIGLGTVVFALGIGPLVQIALRVFDREGRVSGRRR